MKDARAGDEGGDDFKVRVFGRRADEDDRAVFDVGEEGVLLGFVPPMHLIYE